MKILDAGHRYELFVLDGEFPVRGKEYLGRQELQFVKREGKGYPGNEGHYSGTNIQDVLRCLIDRLGYLQRQEPCWEDVKAVGKLREVMLLLEQRAARRHGRSGSGLVKGKTKLEEREFCKKCGHVGCQGECH